MNIRAKGAGLATAATWLATLILLQIAPIAFANIQWRYFLAFIAFNMSNAVLCAMFCPETAGRTLEEIGTFPYCILPARLWLTGFRCSVRRRECTNRAS